MHKQRTYDSQTENKPNDLQPVNYKTQKSKYGEK